MTRFSLDAARAATKLLAAMVVCCGAAISGCDKPSGGAPSQTTLEVAVRMPEVRNVTEYQEFTGRTEAMAAVEVRARVTGYLQKINFQEGTLVKRGEVLFEIDPRPYEAELNRSEAGVLQAQARLKRLEHDYLRAENLLNTRSISREDFDRVVGDRDEASAALKVSEAARELARLNLGFTKVTSPISGRISRQMIDAGNLIKADETLLTTIVSLDPIYAYFDVDERTVLKARRLIREGKIKSAREASVPVQLALVDEQGFPHVGKIDFVDNRIDPMTGTMRLRGVFDNPKEFLAPGLFVRVRAPIGPPHQALLVPEEALASDQGEKIVYVVDADHKVAVKRVKVGAVYDGLREIEEGLHSGEQVIVGSLQQLRSRMEVKIKPAKVNVRGESPGSRPTAGAASAPASATPPSPPAPDAKTAARSAPKPSPPVSPPSTVGPASGGR